MAITANVSQEKFIPIIAEKNSGGKPYLPTFLESRIYIDLSADAEYEDSYEKLLRNLHQRPALARSEVTRYEADGMYLSTFS